MPTEFQLAFAVFGDGRRRRVSGWRRISVYPGENGPLPSLRQKVFAMALYDMRALSLAEEKLGRENVLKLLGDGESMTFANYPRTSSYLPDLRERVNEAIGNACK